MFKLDEFEIKYGKVETALARTYRIGAGDMIRFRGRLSVLQRGDLFGAKSRQGKGNKLMYTPDMMHRMLFCLELTEFGVVPSVQLKLVADFWESRVCKIFERAETAAMREPGDADVVLFVIGISFMGGAWRDEVPNINSCPLGKLADRLALGMQPRGLNDPLAPRVLAVNLSARLRVFHEHLADVHLADEPEEAGE